MNWRLILTLAAGAVLAFAAWQYWKAEQYRKAVNA